MGANHFTELTAAAKALGDLSQFAQFEFASGDTVELDVFDADTFTDALSGECFGCRPVLVLPARERTPCDLEDLSTPQVLALLMDEHQPVVTLRAAQEVLIKRCGGVA